MTRPSRATVLWFSGVLALLIVLIVVRLVTITVPDVRLTASLSGTVRLSGSGPRPDWPSQGEAALTVNGVGSLGTSGGQSPTPTASLAKVMTAYLTLKQHPLAAGQNGFTITITAADAAALHADLAQGQSTAAVAAGERLTERQLLEALLIPSGDNIAQILAAYDAGSVGAFVSEMNRTANALGMDHTTYTDPSGFLSSTVSTAGDQLRVFEKAMGYGAFRQIVALASVTLPVAGTVRNYDPLIAEGYYGKTGSDSAAEGNLAFFKYITVAGRRLTVVGVVMHQGVGSATSVILGAAGDAAQDLVESVLPSLTVHTVLPAGSVVLTARAADGSQVTGRTASALKVISFGGITLNLPLSVSPEGTSLRAGQKLGVVPLNGTLPVPRGGGRQTVVRAADSLPAPGFGWRLSHLL